MWYVAIDCALCLRLMPKAIPFSGGRPWGGLIWLVVVICEFAGHQRQCMLADYYRNIHLFFLRNKNGSELDRSRDIARARAKLPWKGARFQKLYLYFYGLYTRLQELSTPSFQRLFKAIEENGGEVDEAVRQDYLAQSRKYIQLTNILTFNTRAYTLFLLVLLGAPLLFFPIELFVFGGLMLYMRAKYEAIAENILYAHRLPGQRNAAGEAQEVPGGVLRHRRDRHHRDAGEDRHESGGLERRDSEQNAHMAAVADRAVGGGVHPAHAGLPRHHGLGHEEHAVLAAAQDDHLRLFAQSGYADGTGGRRAVPHHGNEAVHRP